MTERQNAIYNAVHDVLERTGLPAKQRIATVAVIINNLHGLGLIDFKIRRRAFKAPLSAAEKAFPTPSQAWDIELSPEDAIDEIEWIG